MNVNIGIWGTLNRIAVFLLFLAGVLGVFFWYLPVIQTNERYRKEIRVLETKVQEQEFISRQLRASIEAVHNDPRVLERQVRSRLGYGRTNETIFRFEPTARR